MTQVNPNWKDHAYPLKQITIKLQGTKHSTIAYIISQLEQIADRINAGINIGYDHDDDYGYRFEVVNETNHSFFEDTAGCR